MQLLGGDINFYAYVGGDPVNLVDPLGLRALTVCESVILSDYFPNKDLCEIDVKDWIPWPVELLSVGPPRAFTLGNTIYMGPGEGVPDTIRGIALIGHEIVHSTQYDQYGIIGLGQRYYEAYRANLKAGMSEYNAYRNIPYERAGWDMEARIFNDLIMFNGRNFCGCAK